MKFKVEDIVTLIDEYNVLDIRVLGPGRDSLCFTGIIIKTTPDNYRVGG